MMITLMIGPENPGDEIGCDVLNAFSGISHPARVFRTEWRSDNFAFVLTTVFKDLFLDLGVLASNNQLGSLCALLKRELGRENGAAEMLLVITPSAVPDEDDARPQAWRKIQKRWFASRTPVSELGVLAFHLSPAG